MKRFLLSVVAMATSMMVCATDVPYSIGLEDCTNGYSDTGSDLITVKNGQTLTYNLSVKTAASGNYQGAVVCVRADNELKVALRVDNWENVSWSNTGITNNFDWSNFPNEINGSIQDITVTLLNGTLTIVNNITTNSNLSWKEEYTKKPLNVSEISVCLGSDHSYVTINKQEVTGEEIALDADIDYSALTMSLGWARNTDASLTTKNADLASAITSVDGMITTLQSSPKAYTQEQVDSANADIKEKATATLTADATNYMETVGTTDFTTEYLKQETSQITLAEGDEATIVFKNYNFPTASNWNNYVIRIVDGDAATNKYVVRADLWDDVAAANTGLTSNYNWGTFITDINGATITMKFSYADKTLTMTSTGASASNNDIQYGFTKTMTADHVKVSLSPSLSYIAVVSMDTPTAISSVAADTDKKATAKKVIQNGRFVIEKNGQTFNAAGAQMK